MPKTSSDDLFHLVRSLSRGERRHFRLLAGRQGRKGMLYLSLFDSLEGQRQYDEAALPVVRSRLPMLKTRLYDLLLRSLSLYHTGRSAELLLKEQIKAVGILYNKGLYAQCEKVIARAMHLAEKYERHLAILELAEWQTNLVRIQAYTGEADTRLGRIFSVIKEGQKRYHNYTGYEQLSTGFFLRINRRGAVRTTSDIKFFQRVMSHPLLRSPKQALSYQSLCEFYMLHFAYHYMRNDFEQAHTFAQRLVELVDSHPHQRQEKPWFYITTLYNLIACRINLGRFEDARSAIGKFRSIDGKSGYIRSQVFLTANNFELNLYLAQQDYSSGMKLVRRIVHGPETAELPGRERMILYFNIFQTCFGAGDYREAQKHLHYIVNSPDTDLRSDLYCFSRILLLVVHFEMGDLDLLEYLVRSTYRFLYKRQRLYKVETAILGFFRKKLPGLSPGNALTEAFGELLSELRRITADPFERKALEYFNFISWLEAKISNRPFSEIVRRNANVNNIN